MGTLDCHTKDLRAFATSSQDLSKIGTHKGSRRVLFQHPSRTFNSFGHIIVKEMRKNKLYEINQIQPAKSLEGLNGPAQKYKKTEAWTASSNKWDWVLGPADQGPTSPSPALQCSPPWRSGHTTFQVSTKKKKKKQVFLHEKAKVGPAICMI